MAKRVSEEFADGMLVNLGTGMPTLCSDLVPPNMEVLFHSEQGAVGFGGIVRSMRDADPYLTNASRQCVEAKPGMCFMDHAESFALARGGRIDLTVIGALQVSQAGDIANYKLAGRPSGLMGGAQDFSFCARRVVVMMRSVTSSGQRRLVSECSLPITAPRVVDLVVSDIGVFRVEDHCFVLTEIAPSLELADVEEMVNAPFLVATDLKTVGVL